MNKEQREKPYFLRRIVAYLIDIIFVMLLSTAISMVFINNKAYQSKTEELMALTKSYSNGEITKEEYSRQFDEMNYYLTKEGVGTTIVNCSVAIVYYVVLCCLCHGITLGKFIMKLRIVSANEKKLNMLNYLIRGLFANLILSNIVSIIFVLTMSKDTFVSIYPKVSNTLTIFLLVTILFVMYRNDGRGLHDLMSNTKVISTKESKKSNVQEIKEDVKEIKEDLEEIKDAKVIKEKKEVKKISKKNSTKKTGGKK